ncbi:unnamed protein product [Euphydryas editha]|uniref:Retrovirus-related Pol polyprotein from transposon TNT 1-94 n=1 Tax=Euphydryas editha TaxID=104508 RepID=A0AAU9ULD1_EUPED|nr:unnamed protein product [Euphydryas editha]
MRSVHDEKRTKLDVKSKPHVFLGYSETSKGYRLADCDNPRKVVTSRDVVFLEQSFYKFGHNNNVNFNFEFFNEFNDIYCDSVNDSSTDVLKDDSVNDSSTDVLKDDSVNDTSTEVVNNSVNDISTDVVNKSVNDTGTDVLNKGQDFSYIQNEHDYSLTVPASGDEDDYCTVSENDSFPDSPADNADWSPGPSSDQGEAATQTPALPSTSTGRPVRSTRSVPPKRYCDTDWSLMVYNGVEPISYKEAMSSPEAEDWRKAMKDEFDSLISNKVWKLVDRPKQTNIVKCKWVYKLKSDASGNFLRHKARLVARGFTQREGIDFHDTFSPVVRHSTMRTLFSLANELDLNIDHVDVTTAFLNGNLNETIYMEQPEGFCTNNEKVCLLQKSIYGLKQSSRMWNVRIHNVLCNNSFVQSKNEPCVYYIRTQDDFVIVSLYVDDCYLFYSKDSQCKNKLLEVLKTEFNIKNLGPIQNYLGIRVTRDRKNKTLTLDQSVYVKSILNRFNMLDCKPVSTPMVPSNKLQKESECLDDEQYKYRQLIGSLMYLSVCTRPDIAFTCSQLSQFNNCFGKSHWFAAKRLLRYLAGTINYGLHFVKSKELVLLAYTDADWANDCLERKSYTGYAIKLGSNVINWESRKQRSVALSSTEAEYYAIADVSKDLCFIKQLLLELVPSLKVHIIVFNDNQSAHKIIENKEISHKRTKHIDVRYHFIKDLVMKGFMTIKYLCTEKMFADVLTKCLNSRQHGLFRHDLSVRPC